jgi:hypothetical protein
MKRARTLLTTIGLAFALAVALRVAMTPNAAPVQAADTDAKITVAHFAPFATTVASTSVSVKVNGSDVLTEFVFPDVTPQPLTVPSGTYTITVVPTGGVTPIITLTTPVEAGKEYFLSAVGGVNGYPAEIYPLVVDRTPATDTAKVRITHLAPFTSTLAATNVDVCTDDGTAVVSNLEYKESTGYVNLPAGIYDLKIAVAGSSCATVALDLPRISLRAGQVADVIARGLLESVNPGIEDALKLGVYTDLTARASIAHFAPFATTVISTAVDVKVDGTEVLSNFVYPSVTPFLDLPVGSRLIQVFPAGSSTPAISQTLVITEFLDFFVAAIGGANSYPLELYPLVNDAVPATDTAKVRITHLAPFASPIASTAVDICTADNTVLVPGLKYKDSTGYVPLAPGIYDLKVALPGTNCATVALDLPRISLQAGQVADVIARGLLPSDTIEDALEINVTTDVSLVARVSVAHLAPFADTISGTAVSVLVNGSTVLSNFVYPSITPYLDLPTGDYLIQVVPGAVSAAADPVISVTVPITEPLDYTVAAIQSVPGPGFELLPFVDDNSPVPAGKARVRVAHTAPFADTIAGTVVDICTTVRGAPVLDDVPYKASATLTLDAGLLSVFIGTANPDCGAIVYKLPTVNLQSGQNVKIYAIGDGTNQPIGIQATASPTLTLATNGFLPLIRDELEK